MVNHKRIFRVYQAAGLSVKRRQRKRLVPTGPPQAVASAPNQQWAIDFVHDRLASGRTIRVLTVVDIFTRDYFRRKRSAQVFRAECNSE